MAVLSAMVFPSFAGFANNQQVQQQTLNVVSDVELAKNKALAGAYTTDTTPKSANWGITFCPGGSTHNSKYTLTAFDASPLGSSDVKNVDLQGDVLFGCAAAVTWKFERLTGKPLAGSGTSVTVSKGTILRTITLNASGSITIN